jgi:D-aspartate ligase
VLHAVQHDRVSEETQRQALDAGHPDYDNLVTVPSHSSPAQSDRLPVLVLGGGITGLGVLRILARDHIPAWLVADGNDLAWASRHARGLPPPQRDGPRGQQELSDYLRSLSITSAVLIPCSDDRVRQVAALPLELSARFPASVSPVDTLDQAVDKARFAALLGSIGVPHPRSWPLEQSTDLDRVPADVFVRGFLKPRNSQAFFARYGVKGFWVASRDEARRKLNEVQAAGLAVQLQEYVPGPPTAHVFVDGFAASGGIIRAFLVRRRLRMYPTDFGNSTLMITIRPEEAVEAVASVERLVQVLRFRGVFSVELKQSEHDGRYYALEMNARPWWYVDYAARAGVDVIWMSWLDAQGRPVPQVRSYQIGRRCVYPYYDWFAVKALHSKGQASRLAWLASIPGAEQPVFRLSDPGPGIRAVRNLLRQHFSPLKGSR